MKMGTNYSDGDLPQSDNVFNTNDRNEEVSEEAKRDLSSEEDHVRVRMISVHEQSH